MPTKELIIKDWQSGVADSPYLGFGMMKLVDIELYPGALKVQKKPSTLFHTALASTFTAVAGTDICTIASGTMPATGTAVVLTTTGTLPAGLSLSTTYFVIKLSGTTCKLATTIALANAGTQIDITDAGSGTHTMTTRNPGQVNHIVKDLRSGVMFFQDSNARVWYLGNGASQLLLLSGNTLTNGAGNGIVTFRNSDGTATYLFVFRNASIDVINVTATSNLETPVWSNAWQSLNSGSGSGNSHHAILAQDNIVYFCDDRFVGSIREASGAVFDPASGATYVYNNQALDVPPNDVCQWLCELGINLLIGGNNTNKIYPWDRRSDSFTLPIDVPEKGIKKLINSGGVVYILAGTNGNIYTTQGSYARIFRKIPSYIMNATPTLQADPVTWGGIALRNGALLVGAVGITSGSGGVYLVYPDGRIVMDSMPSTGTANVTALFAESDFYYMGYSGGADYFDVTAGRYTSFEAIVQSPLYSLATKTDKATFSNLELQVAKPGSGSVRVGYRADLTSAFTTIATFTGDGTATSFESDASLTDLENIQFQLELSGNIEPILLRLEP